MAGIPCRIYLPRVIPLVVPVTKLPGRLAIVLEIRNGNMEMTTAARTIKPPVSRRLRKRVGYLCMGCCCHWNNRSSLYALALMGNGRIVFFCQDAALLLIAIIILGQKPWLPLPIWSELVAVHSSFLFTLALSPR